MAKQNKDFVQLESGLRVVFVPQRAELLYPLPESTAIRQIETCARICYHSEAGDIEDAINFLSKLWKNRHLSVFEHVNLTCFLQCSRSTSHQLVRHRLASYSQESQRYVGYNKEMEVIIPFGVQDEEPFRNFAVRAAQEYKAELAKGTPKELVRALLPNMTATKLYMTTNLRQWMHIMEERLMNPHAQADIRALMSLVAEEMIKNYPQLIGETMGLEQILQGYRLALSAKLHEDAKKTAK